MDTPTELAIQFVFMAIFAVITAILAHQRGRNPVGWGVIGFLFGCFGLILVLVLPDLNRVRAEQEQRDREARRLREQLAQERAKNQSFRQHTTRRLDTHDETLGIDTRTADPDRQIEGPPAPPPELLEQLPGDLPHAGWWFVRPGAETPEGPFDLEDLRTHLRRRLIGAKTLVWHETLDDWRPLGDTPLRALT